MAWRPLVLTAAACSTAVAGPCDIFGAAGTPCAAAHSVTRALYSGYTGPLYQLQRSSDNTTIDVPPLSPGGAANVAVHDQFCAGAGHVPSPPHPSGLPAIGSTVHLEPKAMPGYAFRHCYSQGYVTPTGPSGSDHLFKLVHPLSNTPYAVSFESVNYPGHYIVPMVGEPNRPGIAQSPAALDASWMVSIVPSGGFILTSLSLTHSGGGIVVSPTLNGTCAHSYSRPSSAAAMGPNTTVWNVVSDSGGGGYPSRAACVILKIYDQSGNQNHLLPATPAINNPAYDNPVNATRHAVSLGGRKVYGAYFETGMGYRAQNTAKVARGNDPETIYMVTSGTHINDECCFDYGNSENDPDNHSAFCDGCMEAVYMGSGYGGQGKGPWIGADLEAGIYGGPYVNDSFLRSDFVTAMVKGGTNGFAIKGGNASAGGLTSLFDGPRPNTYQPMHKAGAIILGVGGDNLGRSKAKAGVDGGDTTKPESLGERIPGLSVGTFYEGVMTVGYSTDAADTAVQAEIVAAGYGN
eukprot:m.155290 g.155290  ORF g.155290 m.155290 type:complete len:520 (+) comp14402_c0_seq2:27-1586(+)